MPHKKVLKSHEAAADFQPLSPPKSLLALPPAMLQTSFLGPLVLTLPSSLCSLLPFSSASCPSPRVLSCPWRHPPIVLRRQPLLCLLLCYSSQPPARCNFRTFLLVPLCRCLRRAKRLVLNFSFLRAKDKRRIKQVLEMVSTCLPATAPPSPAALAPHIHEGHEAARCIRSSHTREACAARKSPPHLAHPPS